MRRTVRLEPGSTKNKQGRQVSMTDVIAELLRPLVVGKQRTEQVFTRANGTPVRSIRKAWQNVCCSAGLGNSVCSSCSGEFSEGKICPKCKKRLVYRGLLIHDLRRTAARNLRNAGLDVSTVKKIGGWLTDSMFARYSIVDAQDMQNAMQKLQSARAGNEISVTVSDTMSTSEAPRLLQ
jgi:integrase